MERSSTEEVPLSFDVRGTRAPTEMQLDLVDLRALASVGSPVIARVEGLAVGDTVTILRLDRGNYTVYSDMAGRARIPATLLETAFVVAGNRAYLSA